MYQAQSSSLPAKSSEQTYVVVDRLVPNVAYLQHETLSSIMSGGWVHPKGENSMGSAVERPWLDLGHECCTLGLIDQ